jgi:hypothetical protein
MNCHVIVCEHSQREAEIYPKGYDVISFETDGLKVSQLSYGLCERSDMSGFKAKYYYTMHILYTYEYS